GSTGRPGAVCLTTLIGAICARARGGCKSMALDSYSALQASILSWLARPADPLVQPAVPDMIRLFEAEANRRLKSAGAENIAALDASSGWVILPTNCMQIRTVSIGGAS